jgi:hypothetical protein
MATHDDALPTGIPTPGFTIKLKPQGGGCLHYINVCSDAGVLMPQNAKDDPVTEEHLNHHGIDNLRVPLVVGPARSVTMGGGTSEALVSDVVFCHPVLRIAMLSPDEGELTTGDPRARRAAAQARFMRSRLVELAIKNVEDELGGAKLGRDYSLPRGTLEGGRNYKGGVGSGRVTPVPMLELKRLQQMQAAQRKHAELAAAPGPWRSNRTKVGMDNRPAPLVEEVGGPRSVGAPAIKKGFLNDAKVSLYPNGSDEGMHPEGAGDPLGWMPKGLRNRVGVVDTRHTTAEQQRKAIEAHAGKAGSAGDKYSPEVREILADPVMKKTLSRIAGDAKAAQEAMADPVVERKLRKLVEAGVLQTRGADGKSVPWPPARGPKAVTGALLGAKEVAEDLEMMGDLEMAGDSDAVVKAAIAQMLPSREEIANLANETDTDKFMADLSSMAGMLGLGEEVGGSSFSGAQGAAPMLSGSDQALVRGLERMSQRATSDPLAAVSELRELSERLNMAPPRESAAGSTSGKPGAAPANSGSDRVQTFVRGSDPEAAVKGSERLNMAQPNTVADGAQREPESALEEDGLGGFVLRVQLPGVASMDGVEVDVSDTSCDLRIADGSALRRPWPRALDSSRASAKFLKRSSVLVVKCPARSGIVV